MGKDKFAGSIGAPFCNIGRSYTFLVIGDPCAHPAKLEEAFEANSEGPTLPAFLLVNKKCSKVPWYMDAL